MVWKKPEPIPGFSALKFKEECQARVQAELAGLTPEERIRKLNEDAANGPFGELWKRKHVDGGTRVKKLKVYVDTSVVGGCFDEEFEEWSLALFDMARDGKIVVLVSQLTTEELEDAPEEVRRLIDDLPDNAKQAVLPSEEAARLHRLYMDEGIVGPGSSDDARHVALATVARADVLVSWNMKHIVHYDKIWGYNSVNRREHYQIIEIRTPREVV